MDLRVSRGMKWGTRMIENKRVIGIIVAAGSGKRMGPLEKNKVYLELGGIPILARTIMAFEESPLVDELIVAVRQEELDYCQKEILQRYGFQKVRKLVPGGKERQDTVAAALRQISTSAPECAEIQGEVEAVVLRQISTSVPEVPAVPEVLEDPKALETAEDEENDNSIVFVHDGARPLIAQDTIRSLIEAIHLHGAAVVGVPVKDTIKITKDGFIEETPPRETLWAMQTPQGAETKILKAAMQNAYDSGFYGTDEAVLLEKIGKKVFIVAGKYDNIKITTSEDLIIGEALLQK